MTDYEKAVQDSFMNLPSHNGGEGISDAFNKAQEAKQSTPIGPSETGTITPYNPSGVGSELANSLNNPTVTPYQPSEVSNVLNNNSGGGGGGSSGGGGGSSSNVVVNNPPPPPSNDNFNKQMDEINRQNQENQRRQQELYNQQQEQLKQQQEQQSKMMDTYKKQVEDQKMQFEEQRKQFEQQQISFRDALTQLGKNVGWDASTGNVIVDGQTVTPEEMQGAGFKNINGRWIGSPEQIGAVLGKPFQLRYELEKLGYNIGFKNGTTYINDIPIDTSNFANIAGRFYGSQEDISNIINSITSNNQMTDTTTDTVQDNYLDNAYNQIQTEADANIADYTQQIRDENTLLDERYKTSTEQFNEIVNDFRDFKSPFENELKNIVAQLSQSFNYNAEQDTSLQDALRYGESRIQADLIRRGMDDSTLGTTSKVLLYKELMPKYQNLALEKYNANIGRLISMGQFMQGLNNDAFNKYAKFAELSIKQLERVDERTLKSYEKNMDSLSKLIENEQTKAKNAFDAKIKAYEKAYDKLDKVGYVTNDISALTGLPVGTPSQKAREFLIGEQNKFKLEAERAQNNKENTKYNADLAKEKLVFEADLKKQQKIPEDNAIKVMLNLKDLTSAEIKKEVQDNIDELENVDMTKLYELIGEKEKAETENQKTKFDQELKLMAEQRQIKTAEDASARGWANVAISQKSSEDASARGWANINLSAERLENEKQKQKEKDKTDYFDQYDSAIGKEISGFSKTYVDGEWKNDPNSDVYKKDTLANQRISYLILTSDISRTEKELLFKKYKIPKASVKEQE